MTTTPPPPGLPPKRRWRGALRLIGPLLFVWLIWTVDLGEVMRVLASVPATYLGAALLMCGALVFLKALRWHLLLRQLGLVESLGTSLVIYGDGMFWGTLTPGRLGEFRKLVHLRDRHGVAWLRGAWLSALDRVFDVLAIVLLFCLGVFQLPTEVRALFHPTLFACVLAACILALAARRAWMPPLLTWSARGESRLRRMLAIAGNDALSPSTGRLLLLIALSLVALALYVAMIRVLSWKMPIQLTFAQVTICVVTCMLAGIIPISYFNLGSRELVLVALFEAFGLSRDHAIGFSMLFLGCYLILMAETFVFARLAARRRPAGPTPHAEPQTPWDAGRTTRTAPASSRDEDVSIA